MNPDAFPPSLGPHAVSAVSAVYRRVSTDHQDGSLLLQEKRVLEYAHFKGLTVPEWLTFSDPDTSGRIPMMDRTGGRALLNRLKHGDVQHLIIAKLDRLGRNVRDGLSVLETLTSLGVVLHITDLGGETMSTQGHMGRFMLTLLMAVSQWEVDEIRDRTTKRMRHQFEQHQLTGNVPFGYDCRYTFDDGTTHLSPKALSAGELHQLAHGKPARKDLVDNPVEQHVIRLMAGWRVGGCKLEDIAAELNRLGYPAKLTPRWQIGQVDSVLRSRHTERLLQTPAPEPLCATPSR